MRRPIKPKAAKPLTPEEAAGLTVIGIVLALFVALSFIWWMWGIGAAVFAVVLLMVGAALMLLAAAED